MRIISPCKDKHPYRVLFYYKLVIFMKELERDIRISGLLQTYGKLLTEKQAEIAEMYFDTDQSLAEIAEQLNISRQTVKGSLTATLKKLNELDTALQLQQKTAKIEVLTVQGLQNLNNSEKLKQLLEEIRTVL